MHFVIILLALGQVKSYRNDFKITEKPVIKNETVAEETSIHFSNKSVVSEVQHTICSIKTDDIVAKAQSTASRILTGVCTTEGVMKAIKDIEKTFLEKLEDLKQNLTTLIQSKFEPTVRKKIFKDSKLSPFKTINDLLDQNLFKNLT